MSKYSSSTSFLLLCLCLFLVFTNEAQKVEAKICEKLSKTWSGWCGNSSHCCKQCRDWEGARHGSCHADFPGLACFCYFSC